MINQKVKYFFGCLALLATLGFSVTSYAYTAGNITYRITSEVGPFVIGKASFSASEGSGSVTGVNCGNSSTSCDVTINLKPTFFKVSPNGDLRLKVVKAAHPQSYCSLTIYAHYKKINDASGYKNEAKTFIRKGVSYCTSQDFQVVASPSMNGSWFKSRSGDLIFKLNIAK